MIGNEAEFLIKSFLSLVQKYPPNEQRQIVESLSERFNKKFLTGKNVFIPASIFSFKLGAFESICLYLREYLTLSSKEVATLTNRTTSTVENTYRKALSKVAPKLNILEQNYVIPITVIQDTHFGIQESIVYYLHNEYKLQFNQIAEMMERNYQTVRTAYLKYVEKME